MITIGRWLRPFVLAFSFWLLAVVPAFAQRGKPPEEEPKGYIMQYTLTVLCLVLGVYATARPSKRTTEINKPMEEE